MESSINANHQEFEENQQELASRTRALGDLNHELDDAARARQELEEQIAQTHEALDAQRKKLLEQEEDNKAIRHDREEAKDQANALSEIRIELEEKLSVRIDQIEALERDTLRMTDRIDEQGAELSEAQQSVKALQSEIEDHDRRRQEDAELLGQRAGQMRELEAELQQRAEQQAETDADLAAAKTRLNELGAELDANLQARSATRGELNEWREQCDSLNAQLEERDKRVEKLVRQLAEKSEALRHTESERDSHRASLNELDKELETRSESVRLLQRQLDESSERAATLRDELEQREQTIQRLTIDLEARGRNIDSMKKNVGRLTAIEESLHDLDLKMTEQIDVSAAEPRVRCIMVAVDGTAEIKYPLYKRRMMIGRTPGNDIQIRTEYISREHAQIVTEDESVIEDLGSKNGIYVNSQRVESRALKHGDTVRIGESEFRFVDLTVARQQPG